MLYGNPSVLSGKGLTQKSNLYISEWSNWLYHAVGAACLLTSQSAAMPNSAFTWGKQGRCCSGCQRMGSGYFPINCRIRVLRNVFSLTPLLPFSIANQL